MPDDSTIFALPPVVRTGDSVSLHAFLSEHHLQPVTINASQVEKFSGMAAQIIAAHLKWRAGAYAPITLTPDKTVVTEAMRLLDLDAGCGGAA
jgi:hypothetical protein